MANYVKGIELYNEMIYCQDASLAYTDKLIEMFTLIAERFATKYTYKYPEDRQDCIQQAVVDAYCYWHNFNRHKIPPKKEGSMAFAYVTQIVKNGFFKSWRKIHQDITEAQKITINRSAWMNF